MGEYAVLVPTAYNNGNSVPDVVIADIERHFLDQFGGFTDDGLVRGAWKSPDGKVYIDVNKRYLIATDNHRAMIDTATWLADLLDQEAIYLRLPNNSVMFVEKQRLAATA
jgi:hypothetical protein